MNELELTPSMGGITRQAEREGSISFSDTLSAAQLEYSPVAWAVRHAQKPTFEEDPTFRPDAQELRMSLVGIPEKYHKEITEGVTSREELTWKVNRVRDSLERQKLIQDSGLLQGGSAMVLAALFDPTSLISGVGAVKTVNALDKVARLSNFQRIAAAGLADGAFTAGLEGYVASQNPTVEMNDLAWAIGLSVAAGALGEGYTLAKATQARAKFMKELDEAQFTDAPDPIHSEAIIPDTIQPVKPEGSPQVIPLMPEKESLDRIGILEAMAKESGTDKTKGFMTWLRATNAAALEASDLAVVRELGNIMAGTDAGFTKGTLKRVGLSRKKAETQGDLTLRVAAIRTNLEGAYGGKVVTELRKMGVSEPPGEALTRYLRGQFQDAPEPIRKAGDALRKVFDDMAELQRRAGVTGAENYAENYVPRKWLLSRIQERFEDFSKVIAKAADVDPQKGAKIAEAIRDALFQVGDEGVDHIMGAFDQSLDQLILGMRKAGVSEDKIRTIQQGLTPKKHRDSPNDSHLKHRIMLDEAAEAAGVKLSDFTDNDIWRLTANYVNKVSGRVVLANSPLKIVDEASWDSLIAALGKQASKRMTKEQWDTQKEVLEKYYNHLMGRAVWKAQTRQGQALADASGMVRAYNTSIYMGQMGSAALAELGHVLGHAGLMNTLKAVPEVKRLFAMLRKGEMKPEYMDDLNNLMGAYGRDRLTRSVLHSIDPESNESLGRIRQALGKAGSVTMDLSFFSTVDAMLKVLAISATRRQWMEAVRHGKWTGTLKEARLKEYGIAPEMRDAITEQIRKHGTDKDVNWDAWDHPEAKELFRSYLQNLSRDLILEPDIGQQLRFMDHPVAKAILQFRGHMLASWGVTLLRGVKHHDLAMASMFIGSSVFGALGWYALEYQKALGRDDFEERMEKAGDWENLSKAAVMRSSWSTLLPSIWDTVAEPVEAAGFDPFTWGNYRSSGNANSLVTGSATYSLLSTLAGLPTMSAQALSGDELSLEQMRQLRRLILWQNMVGVEKAMYHLFEEGRTPERYLLRY